MISIALCTYNGAKYLKEQLDSLVSQTYPNLEIVVVDDCSTDNTRDIIAEYALKYPFIRQYINEQNMGVLRNFNKAMSLCKGEYIAISDQDDIWTPDKINILFNSIEDNILVYSNSTIVNAGGIPTNITTMRKIKPYNGSDPRVMLFAHYTLGHSILFQQRLVALTSPHSSSLLGYDTILGLAALNYGSIKYIDQTLTYYRRHATNVTKAKSWQQWDSPKFRRAHLHEKLNILLSFKDLKHRVLIEQLQYLSRPDSNRKDTYKLIRLIIKNRQILYYYNNSIFSQLNDIRKFLL